MSFERMTATLAAAAMIQLSAEPYEFGRRTRFHAGSGSRQRLVTPADPVAKAKRKAQGKARAINKNRRQK